MTFFSRTTYFAQIFYSCARYHENMGYTVSVWNIYILSGRGEWVYDSCSWTGSGTFSSN